MRKTKALSISLLIPFMFLVFSETVLARKPAEIAQIELTPFWTLRIESDSLRREVLSQVAANIIMFVPLGFLGAWYAKRNAIIPVVCLSLFSASIEFLQFVLHIGTAEVDDVISNTAGAIIGAAIYCIYQRVCHLIKEEKDYKQ